MNPEPGATLGEGGRFLIQRRLGAGGMGIVYQALDRVRNVQVALKTLPKIEPRALYRFKREFRLLADLADPNLASLHELVRLRRPVVLHDGAGRRRRLSRLRARARRRGAPTRGYQQRNRQRRDAPALRSATPSPLVGRRIERNPLAPIGEFTRITSATRQLASALRTLHRAGRLHCDLKPSNVMVTTEGRVVVLDFGLALEFDVGEALGRHRRRVVRHGGVHGAGAGVGRSLTPASDWYAVGTMLYEAITGRLPFRGSMFDVLAAKRRVAARAAEHVQSGRAGQPRAALPAAAGAPADRPSRCRRRAPDAGRRHGGAGHRARAGRGGAHRPRAPSRDAAARVPRLGGRAAHLVVRARAVRHGQERRGRSLHRRAAVAVARRWCWRDAVTSRSRCATRRSTAWSMPSAGTWRSCRAEKVRALLPEDIALLAQMFPMLERVDEIQARATRRPAIRQRAGTPQPRVGRVCRAAGRAGRTTAAGAGHRRPAVGRLGQRGPAAGHVQRAACPGRAAGRLASRGARRGQRVPVGAAAAGRAAGVRAARTGDRRARACRRRTPGARPARPGLPDGGRHGHAHRGGGRRQPVLHPRPRGSRAGRVAAGRARAAGRRHDARRGAAPPVQPPPQRVAAAAGRDCRGRPADRRGRGLRRRRHRRARSGAAERAARGAT